MQYTTTYESPLGRILLAADEKGLTGLWFEGQKYFALYLDKEHRQEETPLLEDAKNGLTSTLPGKIPASSHRCILRGRTFKRRYGRFCARFPTGRPRHMERLQGGLQRKEAVGPRRLWAERWDITKSRSLYPVIASWARRAA